MLVSKIKKIIITEKLEIIYFVKREQYAIKKDYFLKKFTSLILIHINDRIILIQILKCSSITKILLKLIIN